MKPFSHQAGDQEVHECKVMVMYEYLAAGERTDSLLYTLSLESGGGGHLTRNLWMFSLLQTPLLREQAAIEAAMADIIFISVSGKRDLTAVVRDWLSRWLDHKENRPYTLAVLIGPQVNGQRINESLIILLQEVASVGGAEFFFSAPETLRPEPGNGFNGHFAIEDNLPGLLKAKLASLDRVGINSL